LGQNPTVRRAWAFFVVGCLLAFVNFMVIGRGGGPGLPLFLLVVLAGVVALGLRSSAKLSEAPRRIARKVLDAAFLAFFVLYTAGAIVWLITGLATATTRGAPSLHESLHRIGGTSPATFQVGAVVAKGEKFLTSRLTLAGSGEVRFRFANRDNEGHNVAIYRTKAAQDPLFVGAVINDDTVDYEFKLPRPGVYFFRCDPHPETMTGIVVVEAGPQGGAPVHTNAPRWVATLARGTAEASHVSQPLGYTILQYLFSVVNVVLAIFLIRVRPRDAAARLLAIGMIGTAAVFNLQAHTTLTVLPSYVKFHDPLHLVSGVSYLMALLVFPDGRLPRFSEKVLLKWPLRLFVLFAFLIAGSLLGTLHGNPSGYVAFFGIAIPVAGFISQASRYRHAGTIEERQQSKLLMWALGLGFLTAIAFFIGIGILRSLQRTETGLVDLRRDAFGVFPVLFLIIPITLVVVLLRRRLWDIERVINRTLVYGTLAWIIGILYVGVVVGISHAVGGGDSANLGLSIVATALAAVAFEPLRNRLQHIANLLVYGKRATPYEVISHFSDQIAEALDTEEVLPRMAEAAARGVGAKRARVRVALPDGSQETVSWPRGSSQEEFDRVVTVVDNGEPVGEIAVAKPAGERLTPSEDRLLADLASQAGLAMRNVRLTVELVARLAQISAQAEDLRVSRQRIVTARDAEQRRLEGQIREGAEEQLKAVQSELHRAHELLGQDPEGAAAVLEEVAAASNETLAGLRDLARGVFPPLLADRGLSHALEAQVRKLHSPARLQFDPSVLGNRFTAAAEAAAYFCCVEALVNAGKHAGAAPVSLSVSERGGWLEFVIEDSGQGFDPSRPTDGTGLQRMRDRLEALGGSLQVESVAGRGTRIVGRVPADEEAERASLEPVG
jgi:signal transduction histidine kinase/plastocyanin